MKYSWAEQGIVKRFYSIIVWIVCNFELLKLVQCFILLNCKRAILVKQKYR